ncbi:MarR family transcriptional regulator [Nocardioides sp. Leaf307]|nr:MarR family transcriptional regulator [Nocardioides sp. Leaf307]
MMTARTEHLMKLEQEVGVLIRRVRRVIGERALAVHEELQPASYLMLSYLADHGAMRSSSMAEAFHIDKGAISRQVQHLADLGLVERTRDPEDGRASLVAATDEAVRRLTDVQEHRRKFLDERLGDWDESELAAFADVLHRYNSALNQPTDR